MQPVQRLRGVAEKATTVAKTASPSLIPNQPTELQSEDRPPEPPGTLTLRHPAERFVSMKRADRTADLTAVAAIGCFGLAGVPGTLPEDAPADRPRPHLPVCLEPSVPGTPGTPRAAVAKTPTASEDIGPLLHAALGSA